MEALVDVDALIAAVKHLSVAPTDSPDAFLLDHGLRVHVALEPWTYSSTPANSLTFASTRGDGVHFGVLQSASPTTRDGPVVMTVPAATRPNFVVAGSIAEFLGLGGVHGWFSLEQLAYRPTYTFELYAHAALPSQDRIAQLFDRLSLKPIALLPRRLQELSHLYDNSIVIAPEGKPVHKPFDVDAFLTSIRSKHGKP